MCCTRGGRSGRRSTPSSSSGARPASSSPCSSIAATASCRSDRTTWARTSRPGAESGSRWSSSNSTSATGSSSWASARMQTLSELRLPPPPRRHLLSIADLERADVERVLETARSLAASIDREVKKLPTLRGRTVVNLFYESSTRTLASFELAAKRLSADTMSLRSAGSSVDKGESLKDTALTLSAYEPDVIVVRHPSIGAPQLVARDRK